ncbi:MAG: hypothetical protein DRN81_05865 [Thermoproteota archaeon]|nr:MAG: hypothetical protein DRN81_05865 [Candidatus Korarchaeota archaeon]
MLDWIKGLPLYRSYSDVQKYDDSMVRLIGFFKISSVDCQSRVRRTFRGAYILLGDGARVIVSYDPPSSVLRCFEDRRVLVIGVIHESRPEREEPLQMLVAPHITDIRGIVVLD